MNERLGLLLHKSDKSFKKRLDAELRKLRLTSAELAVIMDLHHQKKIGSEQSRTVSIIATRLKIGLESMEEIMEKLEKNDWIVRLHDQIDRRREDIFLSSKAQSVVDYLEEIYLYVDGKAYKGFTKEEIDQMESFLKRVVNNLEE